MKLVSTIAVALLCASTNTWAQSSIHLPPAEHAKTVVAFQQELNAEYKNPQKSPLTPELRRNFQGLPFFPVNYGCYVEAAFVRDSTAAPFNMKTSNNQEKVYRKYGELHFLLNGQALRLTVYQSLALMNTKEYADYLFVPFTDLTNGHQSYGGGRYLDLRHGQIQAGKVQLDFNRAYNPYCAYVTGFSCPVPPTENRLPVAILAGVMSGH